MYTDALKFYGIKEYFINAGYYEPPLHKRVCEDIKNHINLGGIYALIGCVGSGKTTLLNKIQQDLENSKQVVVSRSITTEKKTLKVSALITALFYDLSPKGKDLKIPSQIEKRERELIELLKKYKKTVVLIIDEAHDVHGNALISLKRLIEGLASKGCRLSIILAGHPKLFNVLTSPTMEEIGARTGIFEIEEAFANKENYINWLISQCAEEGRKINSIISQEAVAKLASSLQTPLQIQHYLMKACLLGHKCGEKIITEILIDQVLRDDINSSQAQLARKGYGLKSICELLGATPKEATAFLQGKLNTARKGEFAEKLNKVGVII